MSGPIKPEDVDTVKAATLPPEVFDVFNTAIIKSWDGTKSKIYQNEVADALCEVLEITMDEIFRRKYLDVESAYRANGWSVTYDKPGYCETYQAYFVFSK